MADSKEDIWKGQIKKKELNHSIKFANVSFGYGNEAVLKDICDYAVEAGLIEDSIVYRDLFDTKVMGRLVPPPSVVG